MYQIWHPLLLRAILHGVEFFCGGAQCFDTEPGQLENRREITFGQNFLSISKLLGAFKTAATIKTVVPLGLLSKYTT